MSAAASVLRKLESQFTLSAEEKDAVRSLQIREVAFRADQVVVREGDKANRCAIVLDGLACTSKVVADGRRQILAFHVAGDMPDLQSLHLNKLPNDVSTISAAKMGFVDHAALRDLCVRFPRLGFALWRITLIEGSIYKEWVANIGQRDAPSRVAHLLCEMIVRMRAAGLVEENHASLPITQVELSDATGMSVVHVNRSLQTLRRTGSMSFARGVLTIHDLDSLMRLGDFDPSYLYLENEDSRTSAA